MSREPWKRSTRDPVGQLLVGGRDQAAVAEREQVLGREEAEGRERADLGDALGAVGLRGVLDDRDPELGEARERHHAAEQVHRHERPRPVGHPRGDVLRVEVERDRVDVGEDGRRAAARDRLGGRVEGERGADHLVAGADLHRVEREHERVGAVGDADRARHAELLGRLGLERLHVRAQDEDARVEHARDPLLDLRNQALVLGLDVDEWECQARDRSLENHRNTRYSASSAAPARSARSNAWWKRS